MVHIETFHRQVEGNGITEKYLNEKCVVTENRRRLYRNIDYSSSFCPDYANTMCQLLGDVQHNLCCYCMRLLPKNSDIITLEHLIPQSSSEENFERYVSLGYDELSNETLATTERFSGSPTSTVMPPHPHTVAYHNFLISCDGSFVPDNNSHLCCNNARENKFIIPVFFNPSIADEIEYTPEGEIKAVETAPHKAGITTVISAARLNCKTLKEIRKIWYQFRHIDIHTINDAINNVKTRTLLLLKNCDKDITIKNKYAIEHKWQLLLSYSWFHHYYSTHYE